MTKEEKRVYDAQWYKNNKERVKILGIDQSLNGTAVCIMEDENLVDFLVIRTDKFKDVFSRTLTIALKICEIYENYKPDIVHLEGLAFAMRGNSTRDLAGLLFTIVNILTLKYPEVKYLLIPPTTLKKFATGSGKADKQMMVAALPEDIRERFKAAGFKKTTGISDLSDSYWLASYKL